MNGMVPTIVGAALVVLTICHSIAGLIEEERMKLEKEKNQLMAIKDQLNDSTDILESILRLQG